MPTAAHAGRMLLSRLAGHRPTARQEESGGVGPQKRQRVGKRAPSLQACSWRNQREDAFGEHQLSVAEESRRATSAWTQGQPPRSAHATMYMSFRDPRRGGRLTRRIPVYMGVQGYGAKSYPPSSRPCFPSFDVQGADVATSVLQVSGPTCTHLISPP